MPPNGLCGGMVFAARDYSKLAFLCHPIQAILLQDLYLITW